MRVYSLLVFTSRAPPAPHSLQWMIRIQCVIDWTGGHCRSHTCDADTAGTGVWASAGRGSPLHPRLPLTRLPLLSQPLSLPSGGFGFTKGPLKPQMNATTALCELFEPPKTRPLARPLSPPQSSLLPHPTHTSHLSPVAGVTRQITEYNRNMNVKRLQSCATFSCNSIK